MQLSDQIARSNGSENKFFILSGLKKLFIRWPYIIYPCILLLISGTTHYIWLNFAKVITYGDWPYFINTFAQSLFPDYGVWNDSIRLGAPNVQQHFAPVYWLVSFFVRSGLDYNSAQRLVFFLPLIVSILSPYFSARIFGLSYFSAFCAAILYFGTSYFLVRQTGHLPICLVYAASPIVLALFFRLLHAPSYSAFTFFVIAYQLCIYYELRVSIALAIPLAVFLFLFGSRKNSFWILLSVVTLGLLNAYWIVFTIIYADVWREAQTVAWSGLIFDSFSTLINPLFISDWSWTWGEPNSSFIKQPITPVFVIYPLFLVLFLLFFENNRIKSLVSLCAIIGLFLSKQNNEPFGFIYEWLYFNFPLFGLYREASKFWFIYIFSIFLAAGFIIQKVVRHRNSWVRYLIIGGSLAFFSANYFVLLGDYGSLFKERHVPLEYKVLDKYFTENAVSDRVLWMPTRSRWLYGSPVTPHVSFNEMVAARWNVHLKSDWCNTIDDFFSSRLGEKDILVDSGFGFIVIPLQDIENDDDFFRNYCSRKHVVKILDSAPFIERIEIPDLKNVRVYRVLPSKLRKSDQDKYGRRIVNAIKKSGTDYAFEIPYGLSVVKTTQPYDSNWRASPKISASSLKLFNCDNFLCISSDTDEFLPSEVEIFHRLALPFLMATLGSIGLFVLLFITGLFWSLKTRLGFIGNDRGEI